MSATQPLLLLHGVGMSGAVWDGVAAHLSPRFDVIAPTAAGHRGGPALGARATVCHLVDVTERLLDDRGIDTAHIAGNSMGGWMAIELARRGRARSVCAISPAGFWTAGESDEKNATTQVRQIRRLALATRFIASPALRPARLRRWILRDIAEHADNLTHREAVAVMRDVVNCPAAEDLWPWVEQIEPMPDLPCPITLAWAEKDHLLPPSVNGVVAQRRLPGAVYRVLPGVGHVPMIDNPRLCAELITETASAR